MVRLDHINFTVSNLEESIKWYSEIFGFKKVESGRYADGAPWAILAFHDSMIAMSEYPDWAPANRQPGVHQFFHFGLRIDNEADWRERLKRYNVFLDHETQYPHSTSWYIRDPSGHEIEVSYAGGEAIKFG